MASMLSHSTSGVVMEDDRIGPANPRVAELRPVITAVVEHLSQGHGFVVVTGEIGDTSPATLIQQALAARSIHAITIRRGDDGTLGLKVMAAQILQKPEAKFDPQDIETLFDILTVQENSSQRVTLVIDDAECLQPDAVSYLCLLSTLAKAAAPQVVFVGRPDFWDTVERGTVPQLGGLITARLALGPGRNRDLIRQTGLAASSDEMPISSSGAEETSSVFDRATRGPADAQPFLAEDTQAKKKSRIARHLAGVTLLAVAAYGAGEAVMRYTGSDARRTDVPPATPGPDATANKAVAAFSGNGLGARGERATPVIPALGENPPLAPLAGSTKADATTRPSAAVASPDAVAKTPSAPAVNQPATADSKLPQRPRPAEPSPAGASAVPSAPAQPGVAPASVAPTANVVQRPAAGPAASNATTEGPVPGRPTPPAGPALAAPPAPETSISAPVKPSAPSAAVIADLQALLSRGDATLALGDLTGARLLFEKAVSLGDAHAATLVGKTYDPLILPINLARGMDPALAASWYRRAAALGDTEATDRLAKLTAAGEAK